eukprot:m.181918 g.181918  ORF g.181918 m.181918 type:complete len:1229 (+) comp53476_c0_seq9:51-3737(+)
MLSSVAILLALVVAGETGTLVFLEAGIAGYVINGAVNPTLTLHRGAAYSFEVRTPGQPFFVKTTPSSGFTDIFVDPGLSVYGAQDGELIFAVPFTAPNTLYYSSSANASFSGTFAIINAPSDSKDHDSQEWRTGHAILMYLAYSVFLPIGAFLALHRYLRLHVMFQSLGLVMTVVAYAMGYQFAENNNGHFQNDHHGTGGLALLIGSWVLQPATVLLSMKYSHMLLIHRYLGVLIVIAGIVMCLNGLYYFGNDREASLHLLSATWVGCLLFTLLLFSPSRRAPSIQKSPPGSDDGERSVPPASSRNSTALQSEPVEPRTRLNAGRASVLDDSLFSSQPTMFAHAKPQASKFSLFSLAFGSASQQKTQEHRPRASSIHGALPNLDEEDSTSIAESVESIPDDAVVGIDQQGLIISWNQAAKDLFGVNEQQAIGTAFSQLIASESHSAFQGLVDSRMEAAKTVQKGGASIVAKESDTLLAFATRPNGDRFAAVFAIAAFFLKGKPRFMVIVRNAARSSIDKSSWSISQIIRARQQRQALALGAALQEAHQLASDQHITKAELATILRLKLRDTRLQNPEATIEEKVDIMVRALMLEGSTDGATIHYINLLKILTKHGLQMDEHGTLQVSEAHQAEVLTRWKKLVATVKYNIGAIILFSVYIAVNIALFAKGFTSYTDIHDRFAHASGEVLNLNIGLILLPMCRYTWSFFRTTLLAHWIPLDSSVDLYRLMAWIIFAASIMHTIVHILEYPEEDPQPYSLIMGEYQEGMTGIALWACFLIMLLGAMDVVRRAGQSAQKGNALKSAVFRHQIFFFTHHFFVFFYIFVLIHGREYWNPGVWKVLVVVGTIYACERAYREFWMKSVPLKVVRALVLKGGVTHLQISKPVGFRCKPGQYIFLQLPFISKFEWHPFTLSSSPDDKFFSVHIRKAGDWTTDVHDFFLKHPISNAQTGEALTKLPEARIDGPYGTANAEVLGHSHAILVAAGIGATPTISILKHIKNRMSNRGGGCTTPRCECRCDCCLFRVKKLFVVWVCRDVTSFHWFADYLSEVQLDEARRVQAARENHEIYEPCIDIRIYLSGVAGRKVRFNLLLDGLTSVFPHSSRMMALQEDLSEVLFQVGIGAAQQANELDLITSLRSATRFGRPDFGTMFQEVEERYPGQHIGVFYCGPPELGRVLGKSAAESLFVSLLFFFWKGENNPPLPHSLFVAGHECIDASARGVSSFRYKYEIP